MKITVWLKASAASVGRRISRRSPGIGAVLVATALYVWLLLHILAGAVKLALSKLVPRTGKPSARRRSEGRFDRLLLAEVRRIEKTADRGVLEGEVTKAFVWLAQILSGAGRLSLAEELFEIATRHLNRFSDAWIECTRSVAVLRFMQGKMHDAMPCFAQVAEAKCFLRKRPGVPRNIRLLADSWFAAFGHVAMIDFLLKKRELGWEQPDTVFVVTRDLRPVPGKTLLLELARLGVEFKETDKKLHPWDEVERLALVQEFWEMDFPDGDALPYSHAAAKIQNRWEAENRPPNFLRDELADSALEFLRRELGIPEGAWYVCLHVRQSGFHDRWNKVWEQARDADIATYSAAIQAIVGSGGFVVRMGDSTMPRLAPMEGVIDYAHSTYKSEYADILLLSGARFVVGTNSGLSVVPGTYGVPCVLTNWVPVGLPNWFGKDLMIPKLLRHQESGDLVTLEEMFGSNLGFVQNPRDLPAGLDFVENTPEDLAAVVTQMIRELDGDSDDVRDRQIEDAYFRLAVKHGSYRGSRIGTQFIREHGADLGLCRESGQDAARELGPELSFV